MCKAFLVLTRWDSFACESRARAVCKLTTPPVRNCAKASSGFGRLDQAGRHGRAGRQAPGGRRDFMLARIGLFVYRVLPQNWPNLSFGHDSNHISAVRVESVERCNFDVVRNCHE